MPDSPRPPAASFLEGRVTSLTGVAARARVLLTRETPESLSASRCSFEPGTYPPERCGDVSRKEHVLAKISDRSGDVVPLAETSTDAEGHFRIDSLPPGDGRVALWVIADGEQRVVPEIALDGQRLSVVLEPQAQLEVEVEAPPDSTGATVTAYLDAHSRFFETLVGGDGVARFTLPPGDYTVVATAPGLLPAMESVTVEADSTSTTLVLERGRTLTGVVRRVSGPIAGCRVQAEADGLQRSAVSDPSGRFVLEGIPEGEQYVEARCADEAGGASTTEEGSVVEILVAGGRWVRGHVRDEAGAPMQGVPIYVFETQSTHCGNMPPAAYSGSDGAFEAGPFQPGMFQLSVWMPGVDPVRRELALDDVDLEVQLTLHALASVRGRVVSGTGKPVSGVQVSGQLGTRELSGYTDDEGAFTLNYEGHGEAELVIGLYGTEFLRQRVSLPWEGVPTFTLPPLHRLTVMLVDTQGRPAVGSLTLVSPGDDGERPTYSGGTEEDGKVEIPDLLEGDYLLRAAGADRAGETSLPVRIPHPQPLVVRVPAFSTVQGRVVGAGEVPLSGALVRVIRSGEGAPEERERNDTSDMAGRFSVSLPPGPLQVHAELTGPKLQSARVDLTGSTSDLVLRFPDVTLMRGQVRYQSGKVPPTFWIGEEAQYSGEGEFAELVERSQTSVTVMAGKVQRTLPIRWTGAEVNLGEIVFPDPERHELGGTVVDAATGAPLSGATVSVEGEEEEELWSGTTDREGRFLARDLEQAPVTISAERFGYRDQSGPAGQTTLALQRAPVLTVQVAQADPSTTVVVHSPEDGSFRLARSSADRFEGYVAPGDLVVTASADDDSLVWEDLAVTVTESAPPAVSLRRTQQIPITVRNDSGAAVRLSMLKKPPVARRAPQVYRHWLTLAPLESRVQNLTPGTYSVILEDSPQPATARTLQVESPGGLELAVSSLQSGP